MPEVTQEKQIPDSEELPDPSVLKLMKFCQPQYVWSNTEAEAIDMQMILSQPPKKVL